METPTPVAETLRTARSLLQLIALLLPVLAILVQITVNSFRDEPRPHPLTRTFTLLMEGAAAGFLIWAATRLTSYLRTRPTSGAFGQAVQFIGYGLLAVSAAIGLVLLSPLLEAIREWVWMLASRIWGWLVRF
jgi:hypothetical protein